MFILSLSLASLKTLMSRSSFSVSSHWSAPCMLPYRHTSTCMNTARIPPWLREQYILTSDHASAVWMTLPCKYEEHKSETELTDGVLKKRSKTHERLKRTLFNWTKPDKCANFWGGPLFFQATYNIVKQTIRLTYVNLMRGCWRKEKGQSRALCLPPASQHQTDISLVNWLFVFMLYLARKKRTFSKIRAFCPVLSSKLDYILVSLRRMLKK